MSDVNPNNYEGASVTLVGRAGGPAQAPRYDKDGTSGVLELSIAVSQGYKKGDEWIDTGTTWYVHSAVGEYADILREVEKGDKVRLDDARLETREFDRKDGSKGQAFNTRFGTLTIIEKKSDRESGSASGGGGF
jgi:single-stranded DNA-binding protein